MTDLLTSVFVSKTSAVSALGLSLRENWNRITNGESAIRPVTRFCTDKLYCHNASCIDESFFSEEPNLVCGLAAAAIQDLGPVPADTTIIWTGIKPSAESVECGSSDFLRADEYKSWVAERVGVADDGFEINAACVAFTSGITLAAQLIANGARENVLICGADIVSRFAYTGFAALRAISADDCRPFDRRRNGLTIGDGSAAMLLCSEQSATQNHLPLLARISGWGSANDAAHVTAPSRDGSGLIRAIQNALRKANISPKDIRGVCGHGTGTLYNDAMEITALRTVFGERQFPLFSVKGAIGHTLGAAGGIEAALAIECLKYKIVPPTIGCTEPEPGAEGLVSPQVERFTGNHILKINSGFGGCNCAVIFENV